MNKYNNKKKTVCGITFDSEKEADRFLFLRHRELRGEIRNLKLQEEFTLQNAFVDSGGEKHKAIKYRADFTYWETDDCAARFVIEDVKGYRTKEYMMKKKMMAANGWMITEV